jgi:hypothetical protein
MVYAFLFFGDFAATLDTWDLLMTGIVGPMVVTDCSVGCIDESGSQRFPADILG